MQRAMILIQLFLLLLLFKSIRLANPMMALPGCPENCEGSDTLIPYPFGIGRNCSLSEEFIVNCENDTDGIVIPYRGLFMIENIDLTSNQAWAELAIASSCDSTPTTTNFSNNAPFRLNTKENKFIVVGCNALAYLYLDNSSDYSAGCFSFCDSVESVFKYEYSCSGIGCCQTDIPKGTSTFYVTFDERLINNSKAQDFNPCSYAMVVEAGYEIYPYADITNNKEMANLTMPIVLDWAIGNTTCEDAKTNKSSYACRSLNSVCLDSTSTSGGYFCNCSYGYEGNPYLDEGCQGMTTSLGFVTACSIIFFCIAIAKHINLFKKRKHKNLRKKFFDQNQGSLLQQLIASNEEATQNTRILILQELEKATNGFDNALILGRGGHGYVYKGILFDQRVVAVKRSKIDDQRSVAQQAADRQAEINQSINEVVILSQVNHRNVVKLYGCCLETEVPLLDYEFISNETLFNHLHVEEHCSLTWKHRLRIALETARAISYLYSSAASISVLHRDIKSANILLDDNFTAKVSDIGISKSVQIDQTGIDTIIQGTLGYLDPEYHTVARLTQKSDVFSFGVILVELLTRKKSLFSFRMFEGGNLIGYFCDAMEENRLFEILDPLVVNEENKTELEAVAKLAKMCMRLKGEERPTMKEVEVQLDVLWQSNHQQKHPLMSQRLEERQHRAHYSTLGVEQPHSSPKFFSAKEGF